MQRVISIAMIAICIATLSSCTKDPIDKLSSEESRIYITNRDSSVNFSSYKTYSISDSVAVIDNNRFAGQQATTWDMQAVAAVRAAMESRGFVQVGRTQSPDIGINISRLYNTTTNVVNLQNYWGGYGSYYDPFYWGYGGFGYDYPPFYGLVESTEAAVSIDLLDLKNASGSGKISVIWNGVIRGSGIFTNTAATTGVNALFNQSPYIKALQ